MGCSFKAMLLLFNVYVFGILNLYELNYYYIEMFLSIDWGASGWRNISVVHFTYTVSPYKDTISVNVGSFHNYIYTLTFHER